MILFQIHVITFGRPPVAIDIMTSVKGLSFGECFEKSLLKSIDGCQIRFLHLKDLIQAKKASNRPKDQDDLLHL